MREDFYKYKLYFVIAILVIIIMLLVECNRNKSITTNCDIISNTTTDTNIIYKQHIDTIPFIDTIPYFVQIDVPVPVYDTVDSTTNYYSSFEDSLIKGEIFSKVDGVLVNQNFTYTPKFPKYIIKTDSITKTITTNTVQELSNKRKVFLGLIVGGNTNTFNFGPQAAFLDKKDRLYNYNYNLLNNTHNVGFLIKLKLK